MKRSEIEELLEIFRCSLLSIPSGPFARRVHQFTLHGYTYPFVEQYGEAALPDPPPVEVTGRASRRHSMLAAVLLAMKGDFLFFFQADPQDPELGSRRGIRGVYTVKGPPGRAGHTKPLEHPHYGKDYKMHAACPKCGSPFSSLYGACPECGNPLPLPPKPSRFLRKGKEPLPEHVLSVRLPVEPFTVFEREVTDERVYGDMSSDNILDRALVWIGRHDNAMGAGKGSSVRQLLPEEALRIYKLLLTESDQRLKSLSSPSGLPTGHIPILNPDGTPLECVLTTEDSSKVREEISIHTALSKEVNNPHSCLYKRLIPKTVPGLQNLWQTHYLEYVSSEFPWGYTGSTSDYVLVFRPRDGSPVRHAVVIEFKRDEVGIAEVMQAWLYMPWVAQLLGMHLGNLVGQPGRLVEVHLTPVLVGARLVGRGQNRIHVLPRGYDRTVTYYNGAKVRHVVNPPVFWEYSLKPCGSSQNRAEVRFSPIHLNIKTINYIPPIGTSTAEAERNRAIEEFRRLAKSLSMGIPLL
uniref:TspRI endonuclease n=1 Tax=Thermus sp. R TaxID=243901 RepID=Q6UQ59_9DEIN|nr:TspRI endonuclease [Thermus sp. R]